MTDNAGKDITGYNGYFPGAKAVNEFEFASYGMVNGHAVIRVFVKDGKYNGYTISTVNEGERRE